MSDEHARSPFLVTIQGILHIEAESGEEANRKAETWIGQVGQKQAVPEAPDVRVGWLRIEPYDQINPGFRQNRT